jgi:hypothetical protein
MLTERDRKKLAEYFQSDDWKRFCALSDDEREALALSDPEAPEATDEALAEAVERRRRRLSRDAAE